MRTLCVGAAALNQTPLDWRGNKQRISEAIAEARRRTVGLLCLPELCTTGYGCEDAFHSPGTTERAVAMVLELLPETRGMVVSMGLPFLHQNALFNCAVLIVDGAIQGIVAKRFLAGDGVHYEPRWFKAWPDDAVVTTRFGEQEVLLGDLIFDIGGIRIGFEICEDAWVPNRPGIQLAAMGCDVILNPSASHFAFGKAAVRRRFVTEGSRAFGTSYVYANLLGNEAGRVVYDGHTLIATRGELVAEGHRLTLAEVELITARIDIDATRLAQTRSASHFPFLSDKRAATVYCGFQLAPCESAPVRSMGSPWESSSDLKQEEFTRAVALGLFDYLRKSRSCGFVVSLSGGADSSAVVILIRMMVEFAVAELGLEELKRRFGYIRTLADCDSVAAAMHELLITAYQATSNSGPITRHAARTLAEAIDAHHLEMDVEELFSGYVGMVEGAIGRKTSWSTDDIALQNIQARVRTPGVWMLANLRNALLLTTSNRSEAAVGYATMDGDTAGGLAPIAGIDKAFLRQWLRWMEVTGPHGVGPVPALSVVNQQAPTAELRPQESRQTDEDDLMPYDLLDAVERAAIRDRRNPIDTWRTVVPQFPRHSPGQLARWVALFFRLWCRNQWKRERYAPSFHLDDENLDPRSWCRFPILSSGYAEELEELAAMVAGGEGGHGHV